MSSCLRTLAFGEITGMTLAGITFSKPWMIHSLTCFRSSIKWHQLWKVSLISILSKTAYFFAVLCEFSGCLSFVSCTPSPKTRE
jgi:hypothetical protein